MMKFLTEIFNLDKPLPTPPPSLPHMPAIAGAHPLNLWRLVQQSIIKQNYFTNGEMYVCEDNGQWLVEYHLKKLHH